MIFVDSSFWIAWLVPRDAHYGEAELLLRQHHARRFITSNQVRGETWTFLRRRAGHRVAVRFLDLLEASPRFDVVRVEAEWETNAIRWLRRHHEREYSFVDATSFMLMRELRIRDALAFDGDFAAGGFRELRPAESGRQPRANGSGGAPGGLLPVDV